jgi:hypothetical protein
MKYVGKLFGQIGKRRGYFDTGKNSDDWDALEARAEKAEAALATERDQLAAARQRETIAIASWDEERNRALREGARVIEWRDRAEKAEAAFADPHALHAHCVRTLTDGQIAHLFGERMTEVANRADKAEDRVERAEDECLEQARLLGMSGEREADLLGKLERAKVTEGLWKEFITLLEVVEESDSGYKFNPNKISSCRALDGRKLNEILVKARKIVF